jgi:hypothetical protein
MKKIFSVIVLFNVLSLLSAETVFIYIEKGEININNLVKDDSVVWINSMENGVTDSFFENGHIVFSGNSGANPVKELQKLNQMAKSGGAATILVSAVLTAG